MADKVEVQYTDEELVAWAHLMEAAHGLFSKSSMYTVNEAALEGLTQAYTELTQARLNRVARAFGKAMQEAWDSVMGPAAQAISKVVKEATEQRAHCPSCGYGADMGRHHPDCADIQAQREAQVEAPEGAQWPCPSCGLPLEPQQISAEGHTAWWCNQDECPYLCQVVPPGEDPDPHPYPGYEEAKAQATQFTPAPDGPLKEEILAEMAADVQQALGRAVASMQPAPIPQRCPECGGTMSWQRSEDDSESWYGCDVGGCSNTTRYVYYRAPELALKEEILAEIEKSQQAQRLKESRCPDCGTQLRECREHTGQLVCPALECENYDHYPLPKQAS